MATAACLGGDFVASEDDNVLVQGISGDKYSLGYFGYAYYVENQDKLKVVPIDGGSGCIAPTDAAINKRDVCPAEPAAVHLRACGRCSGAAHRRVRAVLPGGERPAAGRLRGLYPLSAGSVMTLVWPSSTRERPARLFGGERRLQGTRCPGADEVTQGANLSKTEGRMIIRPLRFFNGRSPDTSAKTPSPGQFAFEELAPTCCSSGARS